MNDTELIGELSRRASVDRDTARAILDAFRDVVRESGASENLFLRHESGAAIDIDRILPRRSAAARFPAENVLDAAVVDALIARAETHRFGVDFLLHGHLPSVAAEFGAHAFTVEAARRLLIERRTTRSGDDNS